MDARTKRAAPRRGVKNGDLRLYWVAYNVALETDVAEMLAGLEIKAYTRWDDVKGRGHSGPHLNDEVWPAVNALYMFVAPAALEARLAAEIGRLRARYPGEGIKCLVQPCLAVY